MSQATTPRGGAPVGYLADLRDTEVTAVLYFRLWNDGRARAGIEADLTRSMGCSLARSAVEALEGISALCAHHGRRPLMRHAVGCKCLGADEACLAHMIGAAADGEREDAMLMASLMVRPDFAPALAAMAESFGLALRRTGLAVAGEVSAPVGVVLH